VKVYFYTKHGKWFYFSIGKWCPFRYMQHGGWVCLEWPWIKQYALKVRGGG